MTTRKTITNLTNVTKKVKQKKKRRQTCRPRRKHLLLGVKETVGSLHPIRTTS